MKAKDAGRIAHNFIVTFGASLVLGLLSFAGFYALSPILGLAIAAFGLSVLYEGEIYYANVDSTFRKIFHKNYLKQLKANELLEALLKEASKNDCISSCAYLVEYQAIKKKINELHELIEKQKKRHLTAKHLQDLLDEALEQQEGLQKKFMRHVFYNEKIDGLEAVIKQLNFQKTIDEGKSSALNKERWIKRMIIPSVMIGSLFGVGSLFLIADALAKLTFITISVAALPYLVIPLAVIAGVGYMYLTMNSISDMIWNDTVQEWWKDLWIEAEPGKKLNQRVLVGVSIALAVVAVMLTIFTGGTWWTIAKHIDGGVPFLLKIPHAVSLVLVPMFASIAQFIFSFQNIQETMEDLGKGIRNINFKEIGYKVRNFTVAAVLALVAAPFIHIGKAVHSAWQKENLLQFVNPFRLVYRIISAPIRIIGFLGHVASIGATADQFPGVPSIFCAIISTISETFEDLHYFFHLDSQSNEAKESKGEEHEHAKTTKTHAEQDEQDEDHECDHSHDIPSHFYSLILKPIVILSTLWSWGASQLNRVLANDLEPFQSYTAANNDLLIPEEDRKNPHQTSDNQTIISLIHQKTVALQHKTEKQAEGQEGKQEAKLTTDKIQALTCLESSVSKKGNQPITIQDFRDMVNSTPEDKTESIATTLAKHRGYHLPFAHTDATNLLEEIEGCLPEQAAAL